MIEMVKIAKADVPVEREPDPERMRRIGLRSPNWAHPGGRVVSGQVDDGKVAFLEADEQELRHATLACEARFVSLTPDGSRALFTGGGKLLAIAFPSGSVEELGHVGEIIEAEAVDGGYLVRRDDERVALLGPDLAERAQLEGTYQSIAPSPTRGGIFYAFTQDASHVVVLRVADGRLEEMARVANTAGRWASFVGLSCELDGRVLVCEKSTGPFFEITGLPPGTAQPDRGGPTVERIGYGLAALIARIRQCPRRATPDERLRALVGPDAPPDVRALLRAKSEHLHGTIHVGRFLLEDGDPFVDALDGDEEPRPQMLVIGQSEIGDLYVVSKQAKGPFAMVRKLLTEESWREVVAGDSLDWFVRDCVSTGKEKGQRVDIEV